MLFRSNGIYQRMGGREIDMTPYPATLGGLTRSVRFIATIESSAPAVTATVKLQDLTHGVVVTGTTLTSVSSIAEKVDSGPLTVGAAAGDIRDDVATMYEVDLQMTGGGVGSSVACINAYVIITYS